MKEKGNISINTENIFPIIKKFLYSDQDIFLRELVSNAVDATQKIKSLSQMGDMKDELGDLTIEIILDKKKKTITISDKGIGMSAEEIKKYINQIAFSGATEFIEKYKDKDDSSQIIGHFGLGFYSAFMVSKYVEIDKRLFRPHEVPLLLGDYSKAREKLQWEPKVRFKDLAKMMYESDLKNEKVKLFGANAVTIR